VESVESLLVAIGAANWLTGFRRLSICPNAPVRGVVPASLPSTPGWLVSTQLIARQALTQLAPLEKFAYFADISAAASRVLQSPFILG
jgi:hypothetical protein